MRRGYHSRNKLARVFSGVDPDLNGIHEAIVTSQVVFILRQSVAHQQMLAELCQQLFISRHDLRQFIHLLCRDIVIQRRN